MAKLCIAEHSPAWRNPKHKDQWKATLDAYASPVIGTTSVAAIWLDEILRILRPIWKTKTETTSRLRGRIEAVIDYGMVHGWRNADNPARWKGYLDQVLPSKEKLKPVQHHAAVPWTDMPAVMAKLAGETYGSALALRYLALTVTRSNEVRGARWPELDLKAGVWTIPGSRMKGFKDHRRCVKHEQFRRAPSSLAVSRRAAERLHKVE